MKQFIFILFIGLFSLNSFAQDIPPNPELGKCSIKCYAENDSYKWQTMDCEVLEKYLSAAQGSIPFKALQIKLSNLGYDVDVSGKTDLKTIRAFKKYTKDEKKHLRKAKKQ